MSPAATTSARILDVAERTTQTVGYHGLTIRDVAAAVGIKSASVHYHFPSKAHLGAAVARRYTDRLVDHLDAVHARSGDPASAIGAYVALFRTTLKRDHRMCLAGMLAAEIDAIPPEVRAEVRRFVDVNVRWLTAVLAPTNGKAVAQRRARALFAALEGAMLVARGAGDIAVFDAITKELERCGLMRVD